MMFRENLANMSQLACATNTGEVLSREPIIVWSRFRTITASCHIRCRRITKIRTLAHCFEDIELEGLIRFKERDLPETNPQELPVDASDLMKEYASTHPLTRQEWWLKLRNQ